MIRDYAIENLELRKEYQRRIPNLKFEYRFGCGMTTEEKIAFIDKYAALLPYYDSYNKYGGVATYIWTLIEKFYKDRENLPIDIGGYVKTVSLKAWLRKNDPERLINSSYHYGNFLMFGYHEYNINSSLRSGNVLLDRKDEMTNRWYQSLLGRLRELEDTYYTENDPICTGIRKIKELCDKYGCLGSNRISMVAANGLSFADKEWCRRFDEEPVTVEEINVILAAYDKTKKFIDNISAEIKSNPLIKEKKEEEESA